MTLEDEARASGLAEVKRRDAARPPMIPKDQCEVGRVYMALARSLEHHGRPYPAWSYCFVACVEPGAFVGIRLKFGARFLFTEFHHDNGAPYGTVQPFKALDMLPDGMLLREGWAVEKLATGREVKFVGDQSTCHWVYADDETPVPDTSGIIHVENRALFDYLDRLGREDDEALARG